MLDDSEHLLHNHHVSVASLRLLFTFAPECRSASGVVQLATNDGGPLYLGMNDDPKYSSRHVGTLYVLIEEAAI
ncbi:MAG TPA: hypothetical protein VFC29_00280 [Candidatus Limnocylindrales bacterium]|nr:hypothetical protein [Candidatus Limnocylindrales bacterium]